MSKYRIIGDVEEEYLRLHPEERDGHIAVLGKIIGGTTR